MEKLLDGRSAIVTGSGQGLGAALASALAVDGARVLVASRSAEKANATALAIRARGGSAAAVAADLTAPDGPQRVVQAALDEFGSVDILVNNAGIYIWKKLIDVSAADWDRTIATNLTAPFQMIQATAKVMIRQGRGGSIVNIASIHGRIAEGDVVPHCAAKFGLIGLTQAVAAALREHDIRVNAVCPGSIEPDSANRRGASPREKVTQADIASLTVYLASDLARSITGAAMEAYGSTRASIQA